MTSNDPIVVQVTTQSLRKLLEDDPAIMIKLKLKESTS
jgi:hypothetical protein